MSAMTDWGRGHQDPRRRSAKARPKPPSLQPPSARSRPKSDTPGSYSKVSKPTASARRPPLHDRIYSEPGDATTTGPGSAIASLDTPSATHPETFLLRPSIDQPSALLHHPTQERSQRVYIIDDTGDESETTSSPTAAGSVSPNRAVLPVIGAVGSGKSTFVQQYRHGEGVASAKSFNLSDTKVIFHEIDINDVDVLDDGRIEWPESLQDELDHKLDGVVVLYDVMDAASFTGVGQIMRALNDSSTPTALVASKCDSPSHMRVLDPDAVERKVKKRFDDVRLFRIAAYQSFNAPRACVSSLLGGNYTALVKSPKKPVASSNLTGPVAPRSSQDSNEKSSSVQTLVERPNPDQTSPAKTIQSQSPTQPKLKIQTVTGTTFLDLDEDESPKDDIAQKLGIEEDSSPYSANDVQASEASPSPTDSAATFEELIERLLHPSSGEADAQFVATFLTFYRLFATPLSLLNAIILHFDEHDGNIISPWVHEAILERNLNLIFRWINSFPGDFAKATTRHALQQFVNRVISEHGLGQGEYAAGALTGMTEGSTQVETYGDSSTLATAASEIILTLEAVSEDDDTNWACSDAEPSPRNRENAFLDPSFLDDPPQREAPLSKVTTTNSAYDAKLIFSGKTTHTLNAMGRSRPHHESGSSSQTLVNIAESAQRQAALLVPNSSQIFGKVQWRSFINFSDHEIARELTRLDWIMFSSIRPRDLVRHVTIPVAERKRFPALENVTRMTDHFNHLAYWVTNVVLFRDKPKHRAMALEKFMRISRKLRELNNYNALGAVIAGIQSTAVHRLKATKDLVTPSVQKDFMKLEILMAATRGHWAYRLAWENTTGERLPFLPLHRRDLVVADAGGKTFTAADSDKASPARAQSDSNLTRRQPDNDSPKQIPSTSHSSSSPKGKSSTPRVNWAKFSLMGDILQKVTAAQSVPYVGLTANEEIKTLILHQAIVKDDDALYEKSLALEPSLSGIGSSAAAGAAGRKRVKDRIGQLVG